MRRMTTSVMVRESSTRGAGEGRESVPERRKVGVNVPSSASEGMSIIGIYPASSVVLIVVVSRYSERSTVHDAEGAASA